MSHKERIIDQAMRMFVDQGIKSVRMDDIAQQLGVSKRTLYELFGDKEGLLYLSMNRYFAQLETRQTEIAAGARNMLEAMFMVLSDVMNNSERMGRLVTNLKKFYPSVYERLNREGSERKRLGLVACLEQGIADGYFTRNFNIDLSVELLYHTATALIVRKELTLPPGMTEREAFMQVVSNFFRGISTPKGLALIDDYMAAHPVINTLNNQA